jgi:hypothetical protein
MDDLSTSERLAYHIDTLSHVEYGSVTWRQHFAALRRDCCKPLEQGEVREVATRGGLTVAKVWADEESGRYVVQITQFGEVMNGPSGSWLTEQDALRSMAGTLCLLANAANRT